MEEPAEPVEPAKEEPPEPPKAQDVQPTPEAKVEPTVEEPPVEEPPKAAAPVKVEETRSPALTNEEYIEEVRKKRAEILSKMEESYNIEDEDIEAFVSGDADAVKRVLRRLAAKVHVNTFEANQMMNRAQLPGLVKSLQDQEVEETSANKEFYAKWPELKAPKYQETISKIVGTYRTLNPKAEMASFDVTSWGRSRILEPCR